MLKLFAVLITGLLSTALCTQAQDSAKVRAYTEARYYTLKQSGAYLVAGGATAMVAGTIAMANNARKTATYGYLNGSFDKQALSGAILFAGGGVALVIGIARLCEANVLKEQLLYLDTKTSPVQIGKTTVAQTGISLKYQIGK